MLLPVLSFSLLLVGCTDDDSSSKEIELTLDNVDDYLEFSVLSYGIKATGFSYYTHIESTVSVTPASTYYIYNDVTISLVVFGKVTLIRNGGTKDYVQTLSCSLNKGGKGSDSKKNAIDDLVTASLPYGDTVKGSSYTIMIVTGTVELVSEKS